MPEDTIVNDIVTKFNESKAEMRSKRDNWLEMYRLYRNFKQTAGAGTRSNIGIPLAFEWVEVVLSRLFDVFARKAPYVRTKGQEAMDDEPAKLIQLYQNYQYDLAGYKKIIYDVLHQVLIFGTGIVKVYWKYQEGKRTVFEPIFPEMPEAGSVPVSRVVPIYDNIAIELVDVFDFAKDPTATSISDAEWVAHESSKSMDYLLEMEKRGIYSGVRRAMASDMLAESGAEADPEKQEILAMEGRLPSAILRKRHKILEYTTPDEIITVLDGKYKIRQSGNPYECINYVAGKIISTPHEFDGISIVESGAQLSAVIDDITNNILDNQNHAINRLIGVDELRVDDTELISRPFGFFHTRGNPREALYEFPFSDIAPSAYNVINIMHEFAKRITSIGDYVTGQAPTGKTATEAQLLANESAKRIGMHIQIFGDTFVGPLAKLVHKLNKKFQTDEKVFRVTGTQGSPYELARITPDVFGAEIDFIWEHSDRELNNMVARQEMTQLLSIASTNPLFFGYLPTLFNKMLETYDLHQNDRLMLASKLAEAMVPQMQQAAMLQAQMGGGGGGIPNAQKFAGGSEGDVNQSLERQANPTFGSVVNVK